MELKIFMYEFLKKKKKKLIDDASKWVFVILAIYYIIVGLYLGSLNDGFYPGLISMIFAIILFNVAIYKTKLKS